MSVGTMWTSATGLTDDYGETSSDSKLISSAVRSHVVWYLSTKLHGVMWFGIYLPNYMASCGLVFSYQTTWRHMVWYLATKLHDVMWFGI